MLITEHTNITLTDDFDEKLKKRSSFTIAKYKVNSIGRYN